MSTRAAQGRHLGGDQNEQRGDRRWSWQERLDAIRETKEFHTSVKQEEGPRDNDDWGQIPLITEEFHFQPEVDERGFVLGPRGCGRNFRSRAHERAVFRQQPDAAAQKHASSHTPAARSFRAAGFAWRSDQQIPRGCLRDPALRAAAA